MLLLCVCVCTCVCVEAVHVPEAEPEIVLAHPPVCYYNVVFLCFRQTTLTLSRCVFGSWKFLVILIGVLKPTLF